ncbi:hypothetical protein BGZ97_002623 [Linnemannia gamsii]|uniref:Uncharacterized protein n=1 Tax=Linnemannia gamsii TaxID=64522 RepID=A0A9P6QZ68_9FUNG|nr:hypothetical protein BGZ97_002623 [Linnemannia gamsii]
MPITTVPSPEPIVDHETKLPIPNEFKVPVVYKRDRVQGIEPTTKWYEFIYQPGTTPLEKDDKGLTPRPEYWLDGRKLSRGEKAGFDLLSKHNFFVSSTFYGKSCEVCQSELGHWYIGLKERESYLNVQSYGDICLRCYSKRRYEEFESKCAIQANAGVQPKDPKPRNCLDCGLACHRDNCRIIVNRRGGTPSTPGTGSTSIDWYDHESLSAGNCDPMKQFTTDRITIFMELTLKQRVDYMLYWCDPEKREEGFKKADTILLELFEWFDLEDEMKIDFTEHDDYR